MPLTEALSITAPLFMLILIGYGLARWGHWPQAVIDGLGRYVFSLAIPALLLNLTSDLAKLPPFDLRVPVVYFGSCLAGFVLLRLVGARLLGQDGGTASVFAVATVYGNLVMLGLPLVEAVLGSAGLATATTIVALNTIVLWTVATAAVEWARAGALSFRGLSAVLRGIVTNPLILAMLIGLTLSASGLVIPGPLRAPLQLLQQSALPTALVAMGMGLASYRISSGLGLAILMSVCKLLLIPALAWLLCRAFGMSPIDTQALVLIASVPMGVNSYLIARRFGELEGTVSTAIVISTLASALVAPLLIVLLRMLGP